MGDEQHGLPRRAPDLEQLFLHHLSSLRVKRGEGLVHEKDLGVHDQGPGEVDPLLHPTRQLVGIVVFESPESHHLDEVLGPLPGRVGVGPLALQTVEDVPEDGPPGEQ